MDANGDGSLDLEEIRNALAMLTQKKDKPEEGQEETNEEFINLIKKELDNSKSGSINYTEWLSGTMNL